MLALIISGIMMTSPAWSSAEGVKCEKEARRLVQQALADNTFGTAVDTSAVEKIMVEDFSNTTPGTYNQEYEMQFQLVFKSGSEARMSKDGMATFYSAFICDNLQITNLELN